MSSSDHDNPDENPLACDPVDPELFSRVVDLLRRFQSEGDSPNNRNLLEQAAVELEGFWTEHPDSEPCLRLLSECALRLGDLKKARKYISLSEVLDPWNLEILIISESLYENEAKQPRREGEPTRLRSEIDSGVINTDKLLEKALGMIRLGELERAYSLAKLAYCLGQNNPHQLMDILAAGCCFDPDRTRRELIRLEQEIDPPAYLYLALGSTCNVLSHYQEAVAWLGKGLGLAPQDPYVLGMLYNELAYVLAKQEIELQRCVSLARTALEVFPNRKANGFIRDTLGIAYLKNGDIDKAIHNLSEAVAKDPTVIPRFHLALAMLMKRDPAGALAELKQIAAARPSLESPHVEEIAILDRVQSNIVKLENLLNLGGFGDIQDALKILEGLV